MNVTNPRRFKRTLAAFDAANRQDPRLDYDEEGNPVPKELLYAWRMSSVLAKFAPDASEGLQLAARCQHIRRWTVPRDSYPMDRKGYLQWRTHLKKFHSEQAAAIMQTEGYGSKTISQVVDLLIKRNLNRDSEMQTLEDVICLVFLQYYFADFQEQHSIEKVGPIVMKTWNKMSDAAQTAAVMAAFAGREAELIHRILTDPDC